MHDRESWRWVVESGAAPPSAVTFFVDDPEQQQRAQPPAPKHEGRRQEKYALQRLVMRVVTKRSHNRVLDYCIH